MINQFSVGEIMQAAYDIYDRQNRAFRLNLECGLILVNTDKNFKVIFKQIVIIKPNIFI